MTYLLGKRSLRYTIRARAIGFANKGGNKILLLYCHF